MQQSFHALAGGVEREIEREIAAQFLEIVQLADGAADRLQCRLDELEVVQPSADDGHLRPGAEDLDRALQQCLEVAEAQAGIGAAQRAVVVEQLPLGGLAEEARDAAVAEERGQIVSVRPLPQVLIVDQEQSAIDNMDILSMIIAMT